MKNPKKQRKIDVLAQEKYNGDIKATFYDLVKKGENIDKYVDELNKDESRLLFGLLSDIYCEEHGGQKMVENELLRAIKLERLGITEDEVRQSTENPYKRKFLNGFLMVLLIVLCSTIFAAASDSNSRLSSFFMIIGVLSVVYYLIYVFSNIMNFFDYRWVKRNITCEDKEKENKKGF